MSNLNLRKQVPKNLFVNIFSLAITFIVGLWLTPYLLSHLGVIAYGLIPLAMFLSQYISVIINSLNISIGKFLLEAIHQKDDINANKIFSTSLAIIILFIVGQLLLMMVIVSDITYYFTIPEDLKEDSIWLFELTFVGFSISLIRSVFSTSLFAYNRLDILRYIDILQNLTRLILIILFFNLDDVSLKVVGIANLGAAIIAFIPVIYFFKKYTPDLEIKVKYFDKSKVSKIFKMSTWILINQVGVLLLGNIDLYFVNNLIGGKETGEYAIILQVTTIFRTLAGLFAGIVTPIVMTYYAKSEFENVKKALLISSKFMGIFISIVLGISLVFGNSLIALWLGNEYTYLVDIISFSLLFLLFAVPTMPLFSVNIASNKVKIPAITTILFGIINIIMMYILIKTTNLGLWSIVIAKLVLEFTYNGLFMPIYVSKIMEERVWLFLKVPFLTAILTASIYFMTVKINNYFMFENFLGIVSYGVVSFLILLFILCLIIYSKEEKEILFGNFVRRKNEQC